MFWGNGNYERLNVTRLKGQKNKMQQTCQKSKIRYSRKEIELSRKRVRCWVQIYLNDFTAFTTCMIKSAVGMKQPETDIIIISVKCFTFRRSFQDAINMMFVLVLVWVSREGNPAFTWVNVRKPSAVRDFYEACITTVKGFHVVLNWNHPAAEVMLSVLAKA